MTISKKACKCLAYSVLNNCGVFECNSSVGYVNCDQRQTPADPTSNELLFRWGRNYAARFITLSLSSVINTDGHSPQAALLGGKIGWLVSWNKFTVNIRIFRINSQRVSYFSWQAYEDIKVIRCLLVSANFNCFTRSKLRGNTIPRLPPIEKEMGSLR